MKDMCKYARNDMFEVKTQKQADIIAKVLKSNNTNARIEVNKPKYNATVWGKQTNDNNTIVKR